MKRSRTWLFTLLLFIIGCVSIYAESNPDLFPFQDPKLPIDVRVNDLISRLTLAEKISQLGSWSPSINRLGVTYYGYGNEALHGVLSGGMTSFPQAIALSATWDCDLIYRVASAISDEARAKNNLDGRGLTYWSPVINMARDPRWGRTEETYGEDPFLTARIAQNFIHGMQGSDPRYLKTVATVKHFACNNIEKDRHKISSDVDERSLREYYLPAFKACVTDAKVYSVMSAYNAVNGVPSPANRTLLTNMLRNEWGFQGFVVSDCDAVSDVHHEHGYVQSMPEATALSIKSGTDLNCGDSYQSWADSAISSGVMSIVDVDTALIRIFKARFLLGEFDPADMVPYRSIPVTEIDCQEHRDLALLAAKKTIVLLKNQHAVLPLNKDSVSKIAVIGPNADSVQLGGYSGSPSVLISPLQGIVNKFAGTGTTVRYEQGCSIQGPVDSVAFKAAVDLAGSSDVAIVVCGTNLQVASEKRDRSSLDLPGIQDSLVQEVFLANPNTIVVLVTGFPLSIRQMNENIPGIIVAWYDGQAQGSAIADVLTGDYNPGGKLTSTWYNSVADLPAMDHYDIKENRTYQYFTGTPLFPFGYGLSYTTFDYSNLIISRRALNPGDSLKVSVTITNTGSISGEEVPQLYIHHISPIVKRPFKELRDFRRILLQPGENKTVTFSLAYEDLSFYNEISRTFVVEDGTVEIMIGSSSDDIRLSDQFQVLGTTVSGTYCQDALSRIEAENFEKKSKPITIIPSDEGGQSIRIMADDDYLVFKNVDFGAGVNQFEARIKLDSQGDRNGLLEIRLDSLNGPVAGLMMLVAGEGNEGYKVISCIISGASGIHDLFLIFSYSENGFCKIDWFRFYNDLTLQDSNQYDIRLFPNPASLGFQLMFVCSSASEINIEIFTLEGIMIKSLRHKAQNTGVNVLFFNTAASGLSQGMYIVKCKIDNYSKSLKLCIVQ
jgi:beta-glucosidase